MKQAKEPARLERSEYIQYDRFGRIDKIYCKVCGIEIAEQRGANFYRHAIYAELKMRFDDNSYHVTNVCRGCVNSVAISRDLMMLCYNADMDDMIKEVPALEAFRDRKKPKCIALDTKRRGIT